jgi:hypothetical protein
LASCGLPGKHGSAYLDHIIIVPAYLNVNTSDWIRERWFNQDTPWQLISDLWVSVRAGFANMQQRAGIRSEIPSVMEGALSFNGGLPEMV